MALSFNDVNRRNSFTWVKCNDDAQSSYFREKFTFKYGGKFIQSGKYWEWVPLQSEIIPLESSITQRAREESSEPSKTWLFKDLEQNIIKTKNIQEFCREHKLTRSSLYEVISGKRKSHKGFTFIEATIE